MSCNVNLCCFGAKVLFPWYLCCPWQWHVTQQMVDQRPRCTYYTSTLTRRPCPCLMCYVSASQSPISFLLSRDAADCSMMSLRPRQARACFWQNRPRCTSTRPSVTPSLFPCFPCQSCVLFLFSLLKEVTVPFRGEIAISLLLRP